jgi:ABC-type transporter Mla MlaB component
MRASIGDELVASTDCTVTATLETGARPRFERTRLGGWTMVAGAGELGPAAAEELKRELDRAVIDGVYVMVDLSQATTVDSSVVELLLGMQRLLTAFGGRLTLTSTTSLDLVLR